MDWQFGILNIRRDQRELQSIRAQNDQILAEIRQLRDRIENRPPSPNGPIIVLPPRNDLQPRYDLPPGGTPRYELPPGGTPRYELPPGGTPRYELPPGGAPRYDLPPGGAPRYELPRSGDAPPIPGMPRAESPPAGGYLLFTYSLWR